MEVFDLDQNYTRAKFLDALKKQVDLCFSRRRFRCVIFVGTWKAKEIAKEAIIKLGKETNKVKWIKYNMIGDVVVRFDNDSRIRTFTMGSDLKSLGFESIIIDDTVPKYAHTYLLSSLATMMDEEGNVYEDDPTKRVFLTSIIGDNTSTS